MTTDTFVRPAEPTIEHHFKVINERLAEWLGKAQELAPEQGVYQTGVPGFASAQLMVTRGGVFRLWVTDPGLNLEHYQLAAYYASGARLPEPTLSNWGSWIFEVRHLSDVKRLVLEPVDGLRIDDVRQLGHWGWLPQGAVRWGPYYRSGFSSEEVHGMAWIEPGVQLANECDHRHPYYAELTEDGWTVNPHGHTIQAKRPSLRPMIAARTTHDYPSDRPGFRQV